MCYLHGQYNHSNKYLFSHAGVTNTWLKNTGIANDHNLEENINQLFKHKLEPFTFTPGKNNCKEGNDVTQPPTWVRAQSLAADGLEGYTHVVGHTTCQAISGYKNNKLAIKFIDVLRNIPQYATIIDHKFGTETLIKDLVI